MQIEYEATFIDIDKGEMQERLRTAGAELTRPEFMQKRTILRLPGEKDAQDVWMRVRDEGDKITMTWKTTRGEAGIKIEDQKEILVTVDNYDATVEILEKLGCVSQSYQETLRELWVLDGIEVTIDTWPFLEPLVEVEGISEKVVRTVSEKLGFNWKDARFASVGKFYKMKYGPHAIPSEVPLLTFDDPNPFLHAQ